MSDLKSEPERPPLHDPDDIDESTGEVIEDLTGESELLSDRASPLSLGLRAETPGIKPRAYQLEMLEESLKHNTIVAADTGSGKTHIAVIRIIHELERISESQFIWFLAPTVSLCSQQFDVLESQIPAVQIKCLKGDDGVDRWTSKKDWDVVLKNVKIVVSTFQILYDALSFGFVSMDSLALIVFDEAHNCVAKHPGAKIMKTFYHLQKSKGSHVPYILGLTASPVMRSNPASLKKIEETLDAVARSPTKHREELREAVNLPVLSEILYQSLPASGMLTSYTKTIESLGQVYASLEITEDPYVIHLLKDGSEKSIRKLQKVRTNHKTWCQDQMKSLHATSLKICQEMGSYGADWYIASVISKISKMTDESDDFLGVWDVSGAEKLYLMDTLRQVKVSAPLSSTPVAVMVSDKVTKMIDTILQDSSDFRGIIFVQTRAEVAVLFHILSIHPKTRGHLRMGTMVGTSAHAYRATNVGELIDVRGQKFTLALFKDGDINLVIATSVLEEGIDIPACNIVVCFQRPPNLKSFVQRRGRARKNKSKLILLIDPAVDKAKDWQQLEADMKRLYEDEMHALQEVLVIEDSEDHDGRQFLVESTGAILDMDNAVARLYHFCATLPAKAYVDLRPDFICSDVESSRVRCEVLLPLSVDDNVRKHQSRMSWKSEKNAIKDAAFEAYVSLYRAGLINNNLLPLLRHDDVVDELLRSEVERRAAIIAVDEQHNPWVKVAKDWEVSGDLRKAIVTLADVDYGVYLPVTIPPVTPFTVYWDSKTEVLVKITPELFSSDVRSRQRIAQDTSMILEASFGNRFRAKKQMAIQFSTEQDKLLESYFGQQPVTDSIQLVDCSGTIRDTADKNILYKYVKWLDNKPPIETVQKPYQNYDDAPDIPHLSLIRLPRRSDFLHKISLVNETTSLKIHSVVLPSSRCTADRIPFHIVQFGRIIPSIIRRFEITLIADLLLKTILKDVGITDLSLIVTAISASSAQEASNYQRLEFLGDSILKTCTSIQLMAEFPLWHEGYLSAKKDRLVSNSRLSRAAIETGLDKFIITKAFTGQKWRPPYIDELLLEPISTAKRQMSSKILADVVEALIGAAMVDGGIPKALKCLQVFLPELDWQPLSIRRDILFHRVPEADLPPTLQLLEVLIGYSFKKKSLLIEAMTHASSTSSTQSLERLEFLGDAILDNLVVTAMYEQEPELSHFQMHLLRTALVNADFLAFIGMEWAVEQERSDLVETKTSEEGAAKKVEFKEVSTIISLPLYRFMRHASPQVAHVQTSTATRHSQLRYHINAAIHDGTRYPWALLSKLQAQKFYSDIVESLLGAIWVDSNSLSVCRGVIERMGMLPYLRRILTDGVQVWHPKEELGVLADSERVRYVIERRKITSEEPGTEYWCRIFIGEKEIVKVGGGVSKEEIKTKAAEEAVRILKERRSGAGSSAEAILEDENRETVMDNGCRYNDGEVVFNEWAV